LIWYFFSSTLCKFGIKELVSTIEFLFRYNFQTILVIFIFILDINVYLSIYFESFQWFCLSNLPPQGGDTFFNVPSSIFVCY
jgi:hypothetical protein